MRKVKGMFYFTLLLLEPKQDQEKISREKMSIDELKKFSNYLEEQTTKGIPVKARISIYEEETKKGSIALSTNRDGTDVLEILLARVSQPEILRYLAESRGERTKQSISQQEVQESEELQSSVQERQEISETSTFLEQEHAVVEEKLQRRIKKEQSLAISMPSEIQMDATPVKTKKKSNVILYGFLILLFMMNSFLFWKQGTLTNRVEVSYNYAKNQLAIIEKQPTIDTTSRFFLASYFSEVGEVQYKEGLKKFVGISMENWDRPSGKLNSLFLYKIRQEKKQSKVSYLLTIQEEQTTQLKKIAFSVEIKEGQVLVVSQPKIEEFSW
ncbi:TPA: hypothetical protein RD653_002229 [Enterococcus faecalis]|nr:hypothetical protein [Enterococcus faecalis]EOD93558.1 hypothetical protein Q9E_01381 [Enterococcus faecalis EnGen0059]EOK56890.1 hypothetical protein Q9C_02392 [Enterococcus faecalis EnGen0063]EGO6658613.1 hypothetical protein [Enterococcus faecalis]EGO7882474.1 hypothetical protein [Enterococcus faecalis]EGO8029601.1 hypothetical protein [Enterococcus faecalis]